MTPTVILGAAAVLAAWVILSILGNERQRRLNELEANARVLAAAKAALELQNAAAAEAAARAAQFKAPRKAA